MEDPVLLTPPLTKKDVNALDVLALAIYSASYQGQIVPKPEDLMLELVQRDWMLVPITKPTRRPQRKNGNPPSNGA